MITSALLALIFTIVGYVLSLFPTVTALPTTVTSAFGFIFSFVALLKAVPFLLTFFTLSLLAMSIEFGYFIFHWTLRVYHLIRG